MAKNIRLTARDRIILEHIHHFDLSTPNILKEEFFENRKMAAVDSTTRRLREHGLISSHKVPGGRKVYYRLTPDGGSRIGVEVKEVGSSFYSLGRSYGLLHFICRRPPNVTRVKCSRIMFDRLLASRDQRFPRIDLYMAECKQLETEITTTCLGLAVVDLNSLNKRLVDRCVTHSRKFIQRGWFAEVMKAGRFEITVLTGDESKKNDLLLSVPIALRRKLQGDIIRNGLNSPDGFPIGFNVEVIPELDEVVPFRRKQKVDSAKRVSAKTER